MEILECDKLITGEICNNKSYLLVDTTYSTGKEQFCIAIPYFSSGTYTVTLYSGDMSDETIDGSLLFGFTVQRVGDTINITYGRTAESIKEFRVAKNGQIHIITKYGRKLYFSRNTVISTSQPVTYDEYPYADEDYIYEYECGKDHANIYTSWDGIDVLGDSSKNLGDSKIIFTNSENIVDASNITTFSAYSGDKTFTVYKPNQELNKDSNVSFSSITFPGYEGKYLKCDEDGKIIGGDLTTDFVSQADFSASQSRQDIRISSSESKITTAISDYIERDNNVKSELTSAYKAADTVVHNFAQGLYDTEKSDRESAITTLTTRVETDETNHATDITTVNSRCKAIEDDLAAKYKYLTETVIPALETRISALETKASNLEKNKQDNLTFKSPLGVSTANEVSLDETDLVHKSGTETITGNKTVTGVMTFSGNAPVIPTSTPTNAYTAGALYIS